MPRRCIPMMAMAGILCAGRAGAYETKQAPGGQLLRWTGPTVTFVVDPTVEAAVPGGADAVARALASWSSVSGGPRIEVTSGVGGGQAALDGQNTVLVAPDGRGPTGDALAVTVVHYDRQTGEILDADIVINGAHAFAVLAADARAAPGTAVPVEGRAPDREGCPPFDLVHVVSHETGHALGLGDVETEGPVMYAYTAPGDASVRAPASDDLAGLDAVYRAPATAAQGCGNASVGGAKGVAGGAWGALVVVLAGWMGRVTRRRPNRRMQP